MFVQTDTVETPDTLMYLVLALTQYGRGFIARKHSVVYLKYKKRRSNIYTPLAEVGWKQNITDEADINLFLSVFMACSVCASIYIYLIKYRTRTEIDE